MTFNRSVISCATTALNCSHDCAFGRVFEAEAVES